VLFRVLYATPTFAVLLVRLVRNTQADTRIPETLAGIFGGFLVVLLVGTLIVPAFASGEAKPRKPWRGAARPFEGSVSRPSGSSSGPPPSRVLSGRLPFSVLRWAIWCSSS
jgi:hypothetical protein